MLLRVLISSQEANADIGVVSTYVACLKKKRSIKLTLPFHDAHKMQNGEEIYRCRGWRAEKGVYDACLTQFPFRGLKLRL